VGEVFLHAPVPAAVLQAGVVLGDGSASFDMLRHLTERLPAMIAPKWVHNKIQPIAVDDAVHYLAAAADLPPDLNRTFDIAGPDVLSYGQMMRGYARAARLGPRLIVTVPVLTPWLASHWVGVVTPVPAGVAKPLVGSLVHDAVADESDLAALVGEPPGGAAGFDEAVERALVGIDARRWQRTAAGTAAMVLGCAVAGGVATTPSSRWYQGLRKPAWQPPAWLFGPVWTALYAGIVLTSTRTLTELESSGRADERSGYQRALITNLLLNAGWSATFFRVRRLGPATVHAGLLALSSADLARRAGAAGRGKALSLLPYAAWCGFATALTAAVWRRNR
jgi:tryptophan-rich sensory protein